MDKRTAKYSLSILAAALFFSVVSGTGHPLPFNRPAGHGFPLFDSVSEIIPPLISLPSAGAGQPESIIPDSAAELPPPRLELPPISIPTSNLPQVPYSDIPYEDEDSTAIAGTPEIIPESEAPDTTARSTAFLDDIISGRNRDSLVYEVRKKMVYIYSEGDIDYQNMNLKADYIEANMETKNLYAYGVSDTLGNRSRPEFMEGGQVYTMDTIMYNLDSGKAKIKGAATQEGEGWLIGRDIKKMPDNTVHIAQGKYTTCDDIDHPHFYLAMTKGKAIPGKKIIIGYSYLVMEDVPIYFPGLPFGFFPITSGRSSGFIMPTYGEEYVKGFFIRDGGYYFAFNDYVDLTVLGGIYTLGSWQASMASRYVKRYKFNGGFNMKFNHNVIGDKHSTDYQNNRNFTLQWTHAQDPKFRPNSTFSASVNFSTAGSKYNNNSYSDQLNTQTNSSISYSKTWPGKPFSFSTNMSHSQNKKSETMSLSFPNASFNVSTIYPFKQKERVGKEKWYEKLSFKYSGQLQNNISNLPESDFFTDKMWDEMKTGVSHSIPVSASWNVFSYVNFTPSFNYNEKWHFRKITQEWDPNEGNDGRLVDVDTTRGFYRTYDYSVSASASTKIYGMFEFKENFPVRAIRHVLTPTIGFSYSPDFTDPKYGFWYRVQNSSDGSTKLYSPYEKEQYRPSSSGRSGQVNFSLQNNIEMKVRSQRDTTGVKKVKLIDNLSFTGNYNFFADSLKLSPISMTFRSTIIKNFGLNFNATFDPYALNDEGTRKINKFMIREGKLVRLTRASTSFGYTFNSTKSAYGAVNDINSHGIPTAESDDFFNRNEVDPMMRRVMMTQQYYDFDIPWNIGFNYSFSYSKEYLTANITQTLGFNGSVNLTDKWAVTFNGNYDFKANRISSLLMTVTRDLHCWQMNFTWVPIGYKQWSFNISVKSAILRDLKWDKRSSVYDTLYE